MKLKNIYMLLLATIIIVACDPNKEIYEKMDSEFSFSNEITYTLTDDDYDLVDEGFGTFSSIDAVKTKIPTILANNFPALGKGSSAVVSYEFYNGSSPDLRGTYTEFTVPDGDYDLFHGRDTFDNFGNATSDVLDYVNWKGFEGEDGDYMDITFDYYDGSFHGGAVSRVVYTVAFGWQYAFILPNDVYGDFFGESGIDFSNKGEGADKVPTYLNFLVSSADDYNSLNVKEGETLVVQYNYDDRCFGDDCTDPGEPNVPAVVLYIFSGIEWVSYGDAYQTTTESFSFGNDGSVWVPDNTIKYTMAGDDYAFVATNYADINAAGAASMSQYGNYDITIWSDEEVTNSIADVLVNNFSSSDEGQKYLVTYSVWTGSAGDTPSKHYIKEGDLYVIFEE